MRYEVVEALEQAKNARNVHEARDRYVARPGDLSPGDYSPSLSKGQQIKLDQLYRTLESLRSCLLASLAAGSIDMGTSTSLEISWQAPELQVVIELSLYGRLAAVFSYGEIPENSLEEIDSCLKAHNLIRLSDEEKEALETQSLYHQLF
jgi:hypothetical protein